MQKYVIVNLITPVMFSGPLEHKDMLKLGATSGGYFILSDNEVVVGGQSMSTDLKPGPHDAEILQRFLDEAKKYSTNHNRLVGG